MEIKSYSSLPEEAAFIRTEVFMKEQGFKDEFDDIDEISTHLVLFIDSEPAGVCRYYFSEEKNQYLVGRIAVLKKFRGQKLGSHILLAAEEEIKNKGGKVSSLSAQVRASEFYEKMGYKKEGEIFYDEYCPHIWMHKTLL